MKAIVCEMCGSQNLIKKDGVYVCQNCGTKYDPEEAKKLLVEVSGTVKVDNTDKIEKYWILADRAYDEGNYADAEKYYELICEEDPNSWRAYFYHMLSAQRQKTTDDYIPNVCYDIKSNLNTTISMITEQNKDVEKNITEVCGLAGTFLSEITGALVKTLYNNIAAQGDFRRDIKSISITTSEVADILTEYCSTKESKELAIDMYSSALDMNNMMRSHPNEGCDVLTEQQKEHCRNAILSIDPNHEIPIEKPITKKSDGCYVATSVYGSYDCPQVWTLRRYRDYTLAETWYGRAFIRTYYAISPTIVKWFGETEWFKNMWKPKLDRMVKELNEKGVADTPYQDREC